MTGAGADLEAVNPATGEVLEHLDQQPPEHLAEALDAVHARQAEAKRWADALEAELRRRLKLRQTRLVVFGDWEVEASVKRESVWDPVELEAALDRLIGDDIIRAGDVADVITREPVVARSKAKQLASRLTGDAREQVNAACTWREKPGPLTVARSVRLVEAGDPQQDEQQDQKHDDVDEQVERVGSHDHGSTRPPALTPEELFA